MSKKKNQKSEVNEERRGFFRRLWMLLGGVAVVEGVYIGTDFLRPIPRKEGKNRTQSKIVVAGNVEQFAKGSVTPFPHGQFYLVRLKDGAFLALHRRCTHLGCTVPWVEDQNRFVCPCHASSFSITGEVVSAPAPRPLDLLAVRIENDVVKVDTQSVVKRDSFTDDQLVRP